MVSWVYRITSQHNDNWKSYYPELIAGLAKRLYRLPRTKEEPEFENDMGSYIERSFKGLIRIFWIIRRSTDRTRFLQLCHQYIEIFNERFEKALDADSVTGLIPNPFKALKLNKADFIVASAGRVKDPQRELAASILQSNFKKGDRALGAKCRALDEGGIPYLLDGMDPGRFPPTDSWSAAFNFGKTGSESQSHFRKHLSNVISELVRKR